MPTMRMTSRRRAWLCRNGAASTFLLSDARVIGLATAGFAALVSASRRRRDPGPRGSPSAVGFTVHVVCDNYGTHKTPATQDGWSRFHVQSSPTGFKLDQSGGATGSAWHAPTRRFAAASTSPYGPLVVDIRDRIEHRNVNVRSLAWTKIANETLWPNICTKIFRRGY